jgi:DNA-binding beta-propeller fold protein YncE
MKSFGLSKYALGGGVAVALLAGCGGSQLPIATSGVAPQSDAVAAELGGSWIASNTAKDNLLYVSNTYYYTGVTIYDLGSAKLVGRLTGFASPMGLCSDTSGDVYVTDGFLGEQIYEYKHGGTTRIKTLNDPDGDPVGCAFDKTTGNLAVTDRGSGILIYPGASGQPKGYYGPGYQFAAYDNRGNLFVDGPTSVAELPKGGSELTNITLNATLVRAEGIAWDGKYFAICDQGQQPNVIDDFSISGTTGMLKRTVTLDDSVTPDEITISPFGYARRAFPGPKQIIAADSNYDNRKGYVWYWAYPQGGAPTKEITSQVRAAYGVAVSRGR